MEETLTIFQIYNLVIMSALGVIFVGVLISVKMTLIYFLYRSLINIKNRLESLYEKYLGTNKKDQKRQKTD